MSGRERCECCLSIFRWTSRYLGARHESFFAMGRLVGRRTGRGRLCTDCIR